MLTKKQKILLEYMSDYEDKHGFIPSYEEMKVALGQRSKTSIWQLILALEERGYIRRLPKKARAIEILRRSQ